MPKRTTPKIPIMVKIPKDDKPKWVEFAREAGFNGYNAMIREAVRRMMIQESDEQDSESRLLNEIKKLRTEFKSAKSGLYNAVRLNSAQVAALHERIFLTLGDFERDPLRAAKLPEFHRWLQETVAEIYEEDSAWHKEKVQPKSANVFEIEAAEEEVRVDA